MNRHVGLSGGGWDKLSRTEKFANIGSDVERAISWRGRDKAISETALIRAIELIDIGIERDKADYPMIAELARLREVMCDYFYGENEYKSRDQDFQDYFMRFAIAARQGR